MPPPSKPTLGPGAIRAIRRAVDRVFDNIKARFLGPSSLPKRLYVVGRPTAYSLPAVFAQASKEEGVVPNLATLNQVLDVAGGYLDSTRERAKAHAVREVQAFLREAHASGVETDVKTVLGGKLSEVWQGAVTSVRRVVDTEVQHAKNLGLLEGISRVSAAAGVEDPRVFFIVVRDGDLCAECRRLHLLDDGATPRLWLLSEVGHGYHRRGGDTPKIAGLHPHCRCQISTLLPGYGFTAGGAVTYVAPGHDELARQRSA
jgi:hypothetical protein